MFKANVITRTYQLTLHHPSEGVMLRTVQAESEAAARLKCPLPDGWEIVEVAGL